MGQGRKNAIKRAAKAAGIPARELGRKVREAEQRRAEAVRRDTLDRLVAMTATIFEVWSMGMRGGGEKSWAVGKTVMSAQFPALDISGRRKSMACLRLGCLVKARIPVAAQAISRHHPSSFYEQVTRWGNDLQDLAWKELEARGLASDTSQAAAIAYVVFALLCDYGEAEIRSGREPGRDFRNFVSRYRAFADYVIPEGSPLCQPMSNAYWAMRDVLMGHPGEGFWQLVDD